MKTDKEMSMTAEREQKLETQTQIAALKIAASSALEMAQTYTQLAQQNIITAQQLLAQIDRLRSPDCAVIDLNPA